MSNTRVCLVGVGRKAERSRKSCRPLTRVDAQPTESHFPDHPPDPTNLVTHRHSRGEVIPRLFLCCNNSQLGDCAVTFGKLANPFGNA